MEKESGVQISLKNIKIKDKFWQEVMELIRTEVIPYQWKLLNDQVEDAAPSFCMRNFKVAGKLMKEKKEAGDAYEEPEYTYQGFEVLPEDMNHLEDKFYGFVFQDSDLYKWIEAASYSLTAHPDSELERVVDAAIDIVCKAQHESGYLDTYYIIGGMDRIFTNLKDHHELYCLGHLIEGAVAYYQATGKDRLLRAAMRYADYVDGYFGPEEGKCKGYPGHEIAEMALVRLYEVTGEMRYLKLAEFFLDERGSRPYYWDAEEGKMNLPDEERYQYHQAHRPVRKQDEAVGHAVRAMYLYCGMADIARVTGDESLWNACKRLWNSTVHEKMYVTGGIGATCEGEAFSFPYDLPNDLAYAETCASLGLMFLARRMLKIEVNSEYADIMELALYNTVLSGMALDGKSFFYVNPLEVLPEACHKDARKAHVKSERQKWFGCACCPPNLARTIASIGSYAFTENQDTFWIHLYIGAEAVAGNCPVSISSEFPWSGKVSVKVLEDMDKEYRFGLRIPGWCEKCQVLIDASARTEVRAGYMYFTKRWKKGDEIRLEFPMKAEAIIANPMVREDAGKTAIKRGPIVYCTEEADNGKDLHLLEVQLPLEARIFPSSFGGHDFVGIEAAGKRCRPWGTNALYQKYRPIEYEDVKIRYVPYFMWNNRGEGEMQVWSRTCGDIIE